MSDCILIIKKSMKYHICYDLLEMTIQNGSLENTEEFEPKNMILRECCRLGPSFLFDVILYIPVNNFSVILGRVFVV